MKRIVILVWLFTVALLPVSQSIAGGNGNISPQISTCQLLDGAQPRRLFPLGFTRFIEQVAASDLAITKPGGFTTLERLAMGFPMIMVAPIKGWRRTRHISPSMPRAW